MRTYKPIPESRLKRGLPIWYREQWWNLPDFRHFRSLGSGIYFRADGRIAQVTVGKRGGHKVKHIGWSVLDSMPTKA